MHYRSKNTTTVIVTASRGLNLPNCGDWQQRSLRLSAWDLRMQANRRSLTGNTSALMRR